MMKLPLDKQAHFWAGAAIAASVTLYTNPLIGLAACIVVSIGKELRDATGRGTPDVWDAVATVAGAVVILPLLIGAIF
tara:strand:- start:651 stop:884 length:234 start_codon:yes stop_codon:yes gene_type:complete